MKGEWSPVDERVREQEEMMMTTVMMSVRRLPAEVIVEQLRAAAINAAAAAELRRDPNLGSEHKIRSLHWIDSKAAPPPEPPRPGSAGPAP